MVKIHKGHINSKITNPVVTIGMFDGVHLGHKSLLDAVLNTADRLNGESVVLTFEPHPRIVLSKDNASLRFLTSLEEKTALLENAGLQHLIVLPFTREFSNLSACEFVEKILVGQLNTHHLVIGFDHKFGNQGSGSSESVGECASKHGFSLERINALTKEGISVSSTTIRDLLIQGELGKANDLLGYDYFLKGSIIRGMSIGRTMGYPTANLKPDYMHKLIPCNGVYAVEVLFEEKMYKAMLYIGTRPTLEDADGTRSIEANLFDFDGDLYGKALTIYFKHRLRDDIKFENREELRIQIDNDKKDTLELLG